MTSHQGSLLISSSTFAHHVVHALQGRRTYKRWSKQIIYTCPSVCLLQVLSHTNMAITNPNYINGPLELDMNMMNKLTYYILRKGWFP